jgi:hypothetical protein
MLGVRNAIAVVLGPSPIDSLKPGALAAETAPIGTRISAVRERTIDDHYDMAVIAMLVLFVTTKTGQD